MIPVYWGYDTMIFRTDKVPEDDPATKSWGLLYDDSMPAASRCGTMPIRAS